MKLLKHKHHWNIIRTIWPYPDGWGTYCEGCSTLLDSGLEKEEAQRRCDDLNGPKEDVWGEILCAIGFHQTVEDNFSQLDNLAYCTRCKCWVYFPTTRPT